MPDLGFWFLLPGSTGVWGLKKNFALLELLEKLELTDKEASFSDKEVVRNHNEVCVYVLQTDYLKENK